MRYVDLIVANFSYFWSTEVSQFSIIFFLAKERKAPWYSSSFDRVLANYCSSAAGNFAVLRLGFSVRKELIAVTHGWHRLYELKRVVKSSSPRFPHSYPELPNTWFTFWILYDFTSLAKCLTNENVKTRLRLSPKVFTACIFSWIVLHKLKSRISVYAITILLLCTSNYTSN